jgi:hypothetical protein
VLIAPQLIDCPPPAIISRQLLFIGKQFTQLDLLLTTIVVSATGKVNCPQALRYAPLLAATQVGGLSTAETEITAAVLFFNGQAHCCLVHFHLSRPTMEPDIFIFYEKSLVEVNQAILAWSF